MAPAMPPFPLKRTGTGTAIIAASLTQADENSDCQRASDSLPFSEDPGGCIKLFNCPKTRHVAFWHWRAARFKLMKTKDTTLTRRRFLGAMLVAGTAPLFIPSRLMGDRAPSRTLNIAFVGIGGRGAANLGGCSGENIVALCDVDSDRASDGFNRFPDAKRYVDYRVMLEEMGDSIDAVVICTPDHTHFPIAMASMQAGKHVLIEKPLTNTVWEARTLQKAAHHYNVITQMANQGRASEQIRLGKEWFQAGALGDVRRVEAWNGGPNERYFGNPKSDPPEESPIPSSLDWDLWLGPRADRPFSRVYHPESWRGCWDFGNGPLGDWAAHTLGLPYWALELNAPTSVSAEVAEQDLPSFIPAWSKVTWEFPARGDLPPVEVHWYDGGKRPEVPVGRDSIGANGMYMAGSKATLMTGGRPTDGLHITEQEKFNELRQNQPERTLPRVEGNHWREWIDAIKAGGPQPGSNFDYSAPLTQASLLGTIAQRLPGEKLLWDDANGRFTNSEEANSMLRISPRDGWSYDIA